MAALLIAQSWPLRSVVLFFQAAHRFHLSSATEATQGCAECKRARGRRRGDGGASRGRGYGHTEIRCNHHETENKDHAPCRQARRDPSGPLVRWHRGRPAHTHTMRDGHKNKPHTTTPHRHTFHNPLPTSISHHRVLHHAFSKARVPYVSVRAPTQNYSTPPSPTLHHARRARRKT